MRDLIFKNLTSSDHKKRRVSTSEISEKDGVQSVIRRHFICIVREITQDMLQRPVSSVYVLKERNSLEQREKYICRIKGSIIAVNKGRLYLLQFMHFLKISLTALPAPLKH